MISALTESETNQGNQLHISKMDFAFSIRMSQVEKLRVSKLLFELQLPASLTRSNACCSYWELLFTNAWKTHYILHLDLEETRLWLTELFTRQSKWLLQNYSADICVTQSTVLSLPSIPTDEICIVCYRVKGSNSLLVHSGSRCALGHLGSGGYNNTTIQFLISAAVGCGNISLISGRACASKPAKPLVCIKRAVSFYEPSYQDSFELDRMAATLFAGSPRNQWELSHRR